MILWQEESLRNHQHLNRQGNGCVSWTTELWRVRQNCQPCLKNRLSLHSRCWQTAAILLGSSDGQFSDDYLPCYMNTWAIDSELSTNEFSLVYITFFLNLETSCIPLRSVVYIWFEISTQTSMWMNCASQGLQEKDSCLWAAAVLFIVLLVVVVVVVVVASLHKTVQ